MDESSAATVAAALIFGWGKNWTRDNSDLQCFYHYVRENRTCGRVIRQSTIACDFIVSVVVKRGGIGKNVCSCQLI